MLQGYAADVPSVCRGPKFCRELTARPGATPRKIPPGRNWRRWTTIGERPFSRVCVDRLGACVSDVQLTQEAMTWIHGDDATALSDGAGLSRTLWRYETPQRIATMMRTAFKPSSAKRRLADGSPSFHLAQVNGWPAVLAVLENRIVGTAAFEISDGKVAAVHGFAAAERLARLTRTWRQHEPDAPVIGQW